MQFYNERILNDVVSLISVSEKKYDEAVGRYKSLSEWMTRKESTIREYAPLIYPHGSFALGTALQPHGDKIDYDLDIMCCLEDLSTRDISQANLKELVGEELIDYAKRYNMNKPENRTRAWTINYNESSNFHMDIIPCLYKQKGKEPLYLTYKDDPNYNNICLRWEKESNPKGYVQWFRERCDFLKRRKFLAEAKKVKIEEIPEYHVVTPLQKVVILLKRHRDIFFEREKNPMYADNEVSSIILTTLAAHAYKGYNNLALDFVEIVENFEQYMREENQKSFIVNEHYNAANINYIILNPSDQNENFADKWRENPHKKAAFFAWLKQLKKDVKQLKDLLSGRNTKLQILYTMFGEDLKNQIQKNIGSHMSIEEEKYLQSLQWEKEFNGGEVRISGYCSQYALEKVTDARLHLYKIESGEKIEKKRHLLFKANVGGNITKPYDIYWQIKNNGAEAIKEDCIRGEIEKGKRVDEGTFRKRDYWTEQTSYTGRHWVKCFVIQNGYCVAESEKFWVVVK